jgi:CspA family cold shock protein
LLLVVADSIATITDAMRCDALRFGLNRSVLWCRIEPSCGAKLRKRFDESSSLVSFDESHWEAEVPGGFFVGGGCRRLRTIGKVKWFNESKGYGFIKQDSGKDIFVHYSEIQEDGFRTLTEGDLVEFELREGAKGLEATKVTRKERMTQ